MTSTASTASPGLPSRSSPAPVSASSACRYSSLLPYLLRVGPYSGPGSEADATTVDVLLQETRVLVVGAGGLGCELLKGLALSLCYELHVLDLDTVDVSNLNRQFLFRMKDCGRPKAQTAAEMISKRCKGVVVKWYHKAVQDFAPSWYRQFDIVIAGLDNVEAREWLNATLLSLVQYSADGSVDVSSVIPFIDGGTEGFGGQARVFLPGVTSCFTCSLASMPPPVGFPTCTIRHVPRLPEHCIVYALKVEWPLLTSFTSASDFTMYERSGADDEHTPSAVQLDKDDAQHLSWICNRAQARAAAFGITGVTFALTMQSIIPAIASTNAIIAACCVNECWKMRTNAALRLDNYFMYMGGQPTGTNSETICYRRNPQCTVCRPPHFLRLDCSQHAATSTVLEPESLTLQQTLDVLTADLHLQQPSISTADGRVLFLHSLRSNYEGNLQRRLLELCEAQSAPPSSEVAQLRLVLNDRGGSSAHVIVVYVRATAEKQQQERDAHRLTAAD